MTERRRFSFNRDPYQVAADIFGATIQTERFSARVLDTEPFPKEENQGSKYALVRRVNPGQIAGTFHMGSKNGDVILTLIATADQSCLKLSELEVTESSENEKKLVRGPAVVSQTLGIRRGEVYTLEIVRATIPPILRVVKLN